MTLAFCVLLIGHGVPTAPAAAPADTVLVCAPGLLEAMSPWIKYRESQGHHLVVISEYENAEDIRAQIRSQAVLGPLRFALLVGDVSEDPLAAYHLPTHFEEARINSAWGSEQQIATDNWFADLDDDDLPDLAIGRLPARTAEDVKVMVDKVVRYECEVPTGMWRRRIHLVAGVGGFGMITDAILEAATRTLVGRGIPNAYRTKLTYASWRSPYFPDPRLFRNETIGGMNEGCLCWVYMGHGFRDGLDWIRLPIGIAPIMRRSDVGQIRCRSGAPIAVFLSCYGAAFDGSEECLAERMLRRPAGPIAAIGGSRVTMPYGMTVLSQALMKQMFQQRGRTLGEIVMHGKRQSLSAQAGQSQRLIDSVARAISPNPDDLVGERREHVWMFHLLGDPLLRVPHPESVKVHVPTSVRPGEELKISCQTSIRGTGVVELTCRRGSLTFEPVVRTTFDGTHAGMQSLMKTYRSANDDRYVTRSVNIENSPFVTTFTVPDHVEGPCTVRVFVESERSCAIGAAPLYVAREQ